MTALYGREVQEIEIDGVVSNDYPEFPDSYISSAQWADTGTYLSDDELLDLQSSGEYDIHESAYDLTVMYADLYHGDMER